MAMLTAVFLFSLSPARQLLVQYLDKGHFTSFQIQTVHSWSSSISFFARYATKNSVTYTGHLVLLEHWYLDSGGRQPHQNYHYCDVVVGLKWSKNAESCASGSMATGRVLLPVHVKSDDPYYTGYPGFPGWGWAWGYDPTPQKNQMLRNLKER
jgi:hypothetical protein